MRSTSDRAIASFRASTQSLDANARTVIDLLVERRRDTAPPPADHDAGEPPPPELPAIVPTAPSLRTLVIDAGHGGDDLGAKGAGGTTEKDVTLAVARRLKGAVEARLGLRVLMTRDDDRAVAVSDRTAMANNSKADMFISLHVNSSFRDAVAGATVYVAAFDAERSLVEPRGWRAAAGARRRHARHRTGAVESRADPP